MRSLLIILAAMTVGGCAASQAPRDDQNSITPIAQISESEQEPAAMALAFTPPIAIGQETPDVSREPRAASAFVGYDSQTTTYFSIETEDRQTSGGGRFGYGHFNGGGYHDYYDRRTYIDTTGSRTR